ncbi:MAG: hypothetical protein WCY87_00035 [Candidatus Cloacimonadales bacterium]|jgi:hypothetical protein|nr:hypothetical protein [Candidatus Cloacimonadota bacterium]MDY0380529.1 hypothetical protein [Candidatus Cloacimonadaceae bacterium]HCX60005.1 hypothetical protein [Candidatus Cloacimonas sp.]MCB5256149.1 hypothetical protein [Candidatus Cloacimonadota bacterium]MCB5263461.1 hypothetical protein [Candidatus Cloacimonadota bacterium]
MEQDNRNLVYSQNQAPVLSIGQWIITLLIMVIPIVNIIMLIVWAVGSTENPNRKNWAIAQLIFMAIGVVIWILLFSTFMGMMSGMMGSIGY